MSLNKGRGTPSYDKRRLNGSSPSEERKVHITSPSTTASPRRRSFSSVSSSTDQIMKDVRSSEDPQTSLIPVPEYESKEWQRTTQKVVKSVVSIHFTFVTRFDTEAALVSEATGFVVDAERGIIMTNRHVVGPGPFIGYVVFDNHEECEVMPIYRDPVHDFGFLKFDPNQIKHMKVQSLELRPELAKIGTEIRVVGNDAGEKLSILSGFISRLDRNAPSYGGLCYNDFNTEYIQAAASASGGSSGSPVINIEGHVVALQAGGNTEASTDFFLPLNRGKRALECVQQGLPITRGTIQVQWTLRPYDECRRLGLSEAAEKASRQQFPDSIGLLVAETVLPQGPGYEKIKEGDCLIAVNGELISRFVRLDEMLDTSVGENLKIKIERGGKELELDIPVQDLHKITPDRYVEVMGAIFHNLSYQIARLYSVPVSGVYIAAASGIFRSDNWPTGYLLDELDNQATPDLDTFISIMKKIPNGKRVLVRYRHFSDIHSISTMVVCIDRKWYPTFKLWVRNDETSLWDSTDLATDDVPAEPLIPREAHFPDIEFGEPDCSALLRSFVTVSVTNEAKIEGYYLNGRSEYGLVIDAEKGYVLVSRYTLPHDLCEIQVTIANSVVVPARLIFLHPLLNYAVAAYDPNLVMAPIKSAVLSSEPLKIGSRVIFVGHNSSVRPVSCKTRVTDMDTVVIPSSSEISPRYRATNVDALAIDTVMCNSCSSGVIADPDGTVRGLWLSFLAYGDNMRQVREFRLAIDVSGSVRDVVNKLRNGEVPNPRFLDVELYPLTISQARHRGVSEDWIQKVEKTNSQRAQLYNIIRVARGAAGYLKEGDVVLAVNDKVATTIADFDIMYDSEELDLTIMRSGKETKVTVPTVANNDLITDRVVNWCGSLIHKPHHAVTQELKKPPSEVYIVWCSSGSPALQYGLASTYFITEVNGVATKTLDDFVQAIANIADNTYVKLELVTFDNVKCAVSLKTNYHYFPTSEMIRDNETGEWNCYTYECGEKVLEHTIKS